MIDAILWWLYGIMSAPWRLEALESKRAAIGHGQWSLGPPCKTPNVEIAWHGPLIDGTWEPDQE